jgi:hypothetical protein
MAGGSVQGQIFRADPPQAASVDKSSYPGQDALFQFTTLETIRRVQGGGDRVDHLPGPNGFRPIAQEIDDFTVEWERRVRLDWFDGWKHRRRRRRTIAWVDEDHIVPTRAARKFLPTDRLDSGGL